MSSRTDTAHNGHQNGSSDATTVGVTEGNTGSNGTQESVSLDESRPPVLVVMCNGLASDEALVQAWTASSGGIISREQLREFVARLPTFVNTSVLWSTSATEAPHRHARLAATLNVHGRRLMQELWGLAGRRTRDMQPIWTELWVRRIGLETYTGNIVRRGRHLASRTYVLDIARMDDAVLEYMSYHVMLPDGTHPPAVMEDAVYDLCLRDWEPWRIGRD